jgi:hypothetical protein
MADGSGPRIDLVAGPFFALRFLYPSSNLLWQLNKLNKRTLRRNHANVARRDDSRDRR